MSALKIAKRDKRVRDNVAKDAERLDQKREQKKKMKAWDVEEAPQDPHRRSCHRPADSRVFLTRARQRREEGRSRRASNGPT